MIYVALLRGINVGGNNKVDMKTLKVACESAGLSSVSTYINSGNIIFSSSRLKKTLPAFFEKIIEDTFGFHVKVIIRSFSSMKNVIKHLPASWTNDQEMKSDVLFLWDEVDKKSLLADLKKNPVDSIKYIPGAVLWSVSRKNVTKSAMMQLPKWKVYQKMTIRNVNTVRKIFAIMGNTVATQE